MTDKPDAAVLAAEPTTLADLEEQFAELMQLARDGAASIEEGGVHWVQRRITESWQKALRTQPDAQPDVVEALSSPDLAERICRAAIPGFADDELLPQATAMCAVAEAIITHLKDTPNGQE